MRRLSTSCKGPSGQNEREPAKPETRSQPTSRDMLTLPWQIVSKSSPTFSLNLPFPCLPPAPKAPPPAPLARSANMPRVTRPPSAVIASIIFTSCHAWTVISRRSIASGGRVQLSQWPQRVRLSFPSVDQAFMESDEELEKYLNKRSGGESTHK